MRNCFHNWLAEAFSFRVRRCRIGSELVGTWDRLHKFCASSNPIVLLDSAKRQFVRNCRFVKLNLLTRHGNTDSFCWRNEVVETDGVLGNGKLDTLHLTGELISA